MDDTESNTIWLRPPEIPSKAPWAIFRRGAVSGDDVRQGQIGNCWFLAALSVVAEQRPEHILKLFLTKEVNFYGLYQVRLCKDGEWKIVVVDDLFPCNKFKQLLFSKGANSQLWVSILEKAYAKLNNSYAALDGGSIVESLIDLTGAPCEVIDFTSKKFDSDITCARIISCLEEKFLLGASCISKDDTQIFQSVGLVRNHVYSLLGVQVVRGTRLILLRNPWGHQEWNGEWSRHSSVWQSTEAKTFYSNLAPGSFWISYEDLLRYFHDVVICRIHSDYEEIRYKDNFVNGNTLSWYKITIFHTTDLHITLTQPSKRGSFENTSILFCWILVNLDKRTNILVTPQTFSQYSKNYLLEAGNYLVIPITFSTQTKEFVISFHSSKPILVTPSSIINQELQYYLQQSIIDNYRSPIDCHVIQKPLHNDIFIYEWSSSYFHLFLLENKSQNTVFFECDASGSEGLISSRNTLLCHDVIFPMQRQLVLTVYPNPNQSNGYRLSAHYHLKILNNHNPTYLHFPELGMNDLFYKPLQIK
jgi:calpain-15